MDTLFTNQYVHSGSSLAKIMQMTELMAKANPTVTHTTYIVSFTVKKVMVVKAAAGKIQVSEKHMTAMPITLKGA